MSTQELELSRLEPWLRANVPGLNGPLSAEKFAGGQSNPTFKLTAGERQYVLRRKPPGELLASAHAVDREYRVLDALRDTDVPVPDAVALCVDDSVIGSMFYLMEHLEGRIFWDPAVPEVGNAERTAIYDEMNRVLAALLNSLQMGFRTLAVTKRSSEVWKILEAVKTEFGKFSDQLERVDKQLSTAKKSLEDLRSTRTNVMQRRLRDVGVLDAGNSQDVLELPTPDEGTADSSEEHE